jgi:hypothetical protein
MYSTDDAAQRRFVSRLAYACVFAMALLPGAAAAQTFSFGAGVSPPTATIDNTMYINNCNSIEGTTGCLSNGAGWHMVSNRFMTDIFPERRRRALIQFDVTAIAPMADITSVTLTLHTSLVANRSPAVPGQVSLNRVTEQWGEGSSDAGTSVFGESNGAGLGFPAQAQDATWTFRLFAPGVGGLPWSVEGGTFVPTISATAVTPAEAGFGDPAEPGVFVTIGSTAQLVADVQDWVDNSGIDNFGWMIDAPDSGQRWDSSEHPTLAFRPVLTVQVPEPTTGGAFVAALATIGALRRSRRSGA